MPIVTRVGGLGMVLPVSGIPLPNMWLDATKITGLSDSDPVAAWADISGNGNNATQSNASYRPIYNTGMINSLPAIRFNGATVLNIPLTLSRNVTGLSMFIVLRALTATNVNYRNVIKFSVGTGAGSRATLGRDSADPTKVGLFGKRLDAESTTILASGANELMNNTNYLLSGLFDYSTNTVNAYKNKSNVISGSFTSSGATSDTDSQYAMIGNDPTLSDDTSAYAYIAEVLLYKRTVSAAERSIIETFLMNKYGIS